MPDRDIVLITIRYLFKKRLIHYFLFKNYSTCSFLHLLYVYLVLVCIRIKCFLKQKKNCVLQIIIFFYNNDSITIIMKDNIFSTCVQGRFCFVNYNIKEFL